MLGVPGDLIDATEHLLALADGSWHPRTVSLGVVNGRCFAFNSGIGLDASVVERVDANPHRKARWGPYYFAWIALTTFLRRYLSKPPRMEVDAGGRTIAGVTAILQNGSPFTYFQDRPIEIAEGASLESDELAAAVLRRATPVGMSFVGLRALSRRARVVRHRQVTGLPPARELRVRTADGRPLPLQVDGDYLGEVPEARYSVLPEALSVVA
jgi:diacylglycerol kinase family enzyme